MTALSLALLLAMVGLPVTCVGVLVARAWLRHRRARSLGRIWSSAYPDTPLTNLGVQHVPHHPPPPGPLPPIKPAPRPDRSDRR